MKEDRLVSGNRGSITVWDFVNGTLIKNINGGLKRYVLCNIKLNIKQILS